MSKNEQSETVDIPEIWKQIGEQRRVQGAEAFYADKTLKDFHGVADKYIGQHKNFRPQFVKKLPVGKRAAYLSVMPLPQDLAAQLIVSYHFGHQRQLMTDFLNALNVPNEEGLIKEDFEPQAPDDAALGAAVNVLKGKYPAEDVANY